MIREGFLEDGAVHAETYRLSGSEPTLGIAGTPGSGNSICKGQELSKDLATLGTVESREVGRDQNS